MPASSLVRRARRDLIARLPPETVPELAAPPPSVDPLEPLDPEEELLLSFPTVPRLRQRRTGWTEVNQRAFIALLARCGCVARAARAVGMAPKSAYRLRDAAEADGFCAAWDRAIDMGLARVRADALERALHGALVPVYRRGKLVRVEHRRCDRLAIALLAGRDRMIDDSRRSVLARRGYWTAVRAEDDRRSAKQKLREENWAAHQIVLDQIEDDKNARRTRHPPRITRL